jgi:glutathione S-transferase
MKQGDKAAHVAALQRPLAALDQSLDAKEFLVGNRFTVADLNVGSILVDDSLCCVAVGVGRN